MFTDNSAKSDAVEIEERDIQRSKCLLNAAIPASLNGKHPDDIRAVKRVVFEILDSETLEYESAKGALIEGDLFDAAQMLEYKARRQPDHAERFFVQAAILFAPVMTVKSIMAFEQAQKMDVDLDPYRAMMSRLYERMGDPKAAKIQSDLDRKYRALHPELKIGSPQKDVGDPPRADNVTYLNFGR